MRGIKFHGLLLPRVPVYNVAYLAGKDIEAIPLAYPIVDPIVVIIKVDDVCNSNVRDMPVDPIQLHNYVLNIALFGPSWEGGAIKKGTNLRQYAGFILPRSNQVPILHICNEVHFPILIDHDAALRNCQRNLSF